jgi:hypothetical protein
MAKCTISLNVTPWSQYKTRNDHDDNLIQAFPLREREVRECMMRVRTFAMSIPEFILIPEDNYRFDSFDADLTPEQAKMLGTCSAVKSITFIPESVKP